MSSIDDDEPMDDEGTQEADTSRAPITSATAWIITGVVGVALFAVMAVIGYAASSESNDEIGSAQTSTTSDGGSTDGGGSSDDGASSDQSAAVMQFAGVEVIERSEETSLELAAEQTRAVALTVVSAAGLLEPDPGATEENGVPELANASGRSNDSSRSSASDTMVTGSVEGLAVPPDPTAEDFDEPHPVPAAVLEDDATIAGFIDWESIGIVEVANDLRFDMCAGRSPSSPRIPGCPDGATAATVVDTSGGRVLIDDTPLDTLGSYRAELFILNPTDSRTCRSSSETFRVTVLTNRPSELSVSAWNYRPGDGSRTDPPPERATTQLLRTAEEDEAAWYLQLDGGIPENLLYCIAFADLDHGGIALHLAGISTYVFDGGASEQDNNATTWSNVGIGRPPTGTTSIGTETLYVRPFRRASSGETTYIRADPYPSTCDVAGDVEHIGGGDDSSLAVLDTTIPIDTLAGDWGWGTEWNMMDIHRLYLTRGQPYLVCVFWVDGGGPSFRPEAVTMSEGLVVIPPDLNDMTVSIDSAQYADWIDDDPAINSLSITANLDSCQQANLTASSLQHDGIFLDETMPLCSPESLQGVIARGGFEVTIAATDSLDDTYRRTSFIQVDRGSLMCGDPCGQRRDMVAVPMPWVAPRAIRGYVDVGSGFSFDSAAIAPVEDGEPGGEGPPVGSVVLELLYTPNSADAPPSWVMTEPIEVDQSDPELPDEAQIEVRVSSAGYGYRFVDPLDPDSALIATVDVEILADRPVDVTVTVAGFEDETCSTGTAGPPGYSTTTLGARHVFRLDNLCVGTHYNMIVSANDETGSEAQIFGVGPADGTTPTPFVTAFVPVTLTAELTFGDPGAIYEAENEENIWYFVHDPWLEIWPDSPRWRPASPWWQDTSEFGPTLWAKHDPYDGILCDRSGPDPLERSTPRTLDRRWPVFATESGLRVRLSASLHHDEPPVRTSGCSRVMTPPVVTYRLDEMFTMSELRAGVELVSDDGLVRLQVVF